MTQSLISFVKRYWQFIIIAVLLAALFYKKAPIYRYEQEISSYPAIEDAGALKSIVGRGEAFNEAPPAPEITDRMVVKNSSLSLLVENVRDIQKQIIEKAESFGGYMVDSWLNSPEGAERGTVTVRVPVEKLDEAISYFGSLSVRVVSENMVGTDVTDQYVDIQARLDTLGKTKSKFEEILAKSEEIQDILSAQREIINVQEQIDSLKGRAKYLEKTAQMAKITISLSTDELSLPYAPTEAWRPRVIFKKAVRSLVGSARKAGTAVIWVGVYSVVWLPVTGVVYLIKKKAKSKKKIIS